MSIEVDGILELIKKLPPYERQELLDEISEKYEKEINASDYSHSLIYFRKDSESKKITIEKLSEELKVLKEEVAITEELRSINNKLDEMRG